MKLLRRLLPALAAGLVAVPAFAQLKAPREPAPATPARQPAPAQGQQPASSAAAAASDKPANAEKEAAGKLAAAGWLVLLDRRDWGRAWETASAVFRGTVPLATWMDSIPKVREPFGQLIERTPAESAYKTTLEGRPDGEYVTVIFMSRFNNKDVQEIVTTVREPDGRWRVTGYSPR